MDYREKLGKESEWGRARENDFGSPYGIFVNPLLYRSMRYHTQKSIEILHIIRNWWKGVWKIRRDIWIREKKRQEIHNYSGFMQADWAQRFDIEISTNRTRFGVCCICSKIESTSECENEFQIRFFLFLSYSTRYTYTHRMC